MKLHPDHLADLRRSGLTDETIAAAGFSSVSEFELRKELGPIAARVDSAYRIPYDETFCRYKIFPALDGQKYTQATGSGCRLYLTQPALAVRTDPHVTIYVVEGEKKALRLAQEGLAVIAIGGIWNWRADGRAIDDFGRFDWCDREAVIVPDSDTWTQDNLKQPVFALGKEIETRGAKPKVLKLPQKEEDKVGVDDYLVTRSLDDLRSETHLKLSHNVFGRTREWWKQWIKEEKGAQGDTGFQDVEPHPEEVSGAELFEDVRAFISKYIAMSRDAALAAALWVFKTWVLDAFHVAPILNISSPTKRCGKTRLLQVLSLLVRRPLHASNITAPSVFRTVDKFEPTLLIDEADTFLKQNDELRGVLNCSHYRPTAFVVRLVGDALEPKQFSTWCAKAIAGIGKLKADTLEDRSISIPLKRKGADEAVTRLRHQEAHAKAGPLRQRLARWAVDNLEELRALVDNIEAPSTLNDREQDNWLPLIAIAQRVGIKDDAEKAAVAFGAKKEDEDAKIMLLEDIRSAFEGLGAGHLHEEGVALHSEELVDFLKGKEDRPWPEWNKKRKEMGITARQVAALLKPFGVTPKQIKKDNVNRRGYKEEWFKEAFSLYLSATTATTQQAQQVTEETDPLPASGSNGDPLHVNPQEKEEVTPNGSGVADEIPGEGGGCSCECHGNGALFCYKCMDASHPEQQGQARQ